MKMIKKITAVLTAALLLCSAVVLCGVSAAGADFAVSVSADIQQAAPGDSVVFTVSVKDITVDGGLIGVDIPFSFDDGVFELVDVSSELPDAWASPIDLSWSAAQDGFLWLRALDDGDSFETGCSKDGDIRFFVTLRVLADAEIGVSSVAVADVGSDGICGTVGNTLAKAIGTGDSVDIDVASVVEVVRGDVDRDGKANPFDASLVLRHDAMIITLSEAQIAAGDVDRDGNVTPFDASLILRYDAMLITWEELDASLGAS